MGNHRNVNNSVYIILYREFRKICENLENLGNLRFFRKIPVYRNPGNSRAGNSVQKSCIYKYFCIFSKPYIHK